MASPIVIDTNVWLSASLNQSSTPSKLVQLLFRQGVRAAFSQDTFDELRSRLWRPKFDRYVTMEMRQCFLLQVSENAHWCNVPATVSAKHWSRDPDDDKFIHVAQTAKATRLISGDGDLLDLDPLGDLRIVTPRAALDALNTP